MLSGSKLRVFEKAGEFGIRQRENVKDNNYWDVKTGGLVRLLGHEVAPSKLKQGSKAIESDVVGEFSVDGDRCIGDEWSLWR